MEEFKIIQPSPLLVPYVKNYWLLKTVGDSGAWIRTVPTGMMSLIFHRGSRPIAVYDNGLHPHAFLCGQEKTFADLQYSGQIDMLSVVFRPAGVRAFFNLPINKIYNSRVTAEDLEDKELADLECSLVNTADDRLCILGIERFLLKRLSSFAGHHLQRINSAICLINSGQTDVAVLADAACLGTKQFQRIFSAYVGSNPKEFSRTIRFQKALYILDTQPEIPFTTLAYECGYFDQAHMIKEFKSLSGYTPSEYLIACLPYSDYFS